MLQRFSFAAFVTMLLRLALHCRSRRQACSLLRARGFLQKLRRGSRSSGRPMARLSCRIQRENLSAQATVRLEQKRHAFLFGCNIFQWGRIERSPTAGAYLEKFARAAEFRDPAILLAAVRTGSRETWPRLCRESGSLVSGAGNYCQGAPSCLEFRGSALVAGGSPGSLPASARSD